MKKSFYLFLVALFTLAFNNSSFAQNTPKTDEPASLRQTHKPVVEKPVKEERKMEVKNHESKTNSTTVSRNVDHSKATNNGNSDAKKPKKRLPKVMVTQTQNANNNNSNQKQK